MNIRELPLLAALLCGSNALDAETRILVPDDQSSVTAKVGSTVHDFTVAVKEYALQAETGPGGDIRSGVFTAQVGKVDSDDTSRDKDMYKWAEETKHPTITYSVASFTYDAKGQATAKGTLSWHGVSKALDIPVAITRKDGKVAIDASFKLDHRDWGLPKIRNMFVLTVDPVMDFTIHLSGTLVPKPAATTPLAPAIPPATPPTPATAKAK